MKKLVSLGKEFGCCFRCCVLLFLITVSLCIARTTEVVGYYPDWGTSRLPIDRIDYDKLDHIIYFSISPNADGSLDLSSINMANLKKLAATAQANQVKLSICAGGWGKSNHFSAMAANPTARANFVKNATRFCLDNSLDGFDLDWEPVSASADKENYTKLIRDLKTAFKPYLIELSVAVASRGTEFAPSAIESIDSLHVMSYDMGNPHSSFPKAVASINHWLDFGFPKDKIYMGVPFYGRNSQTSYTYKDLVVNHKPEKNIDLVNGINFNGIDTIKKKAEFVAQNHFAGIMIWEISQDTNDHTSLLHTIDKALAARPDLDRSGKVDFLDLSILAQDWLRTDNYRCDLNGDNKIDITDFLIIIHQYLNNSAE